MRGVVYRQIDGRAIVTLRTQRPLQARPIILGAPAQPGQAGRWPVDQPAGLRGLLEKLAQGPVLDPPDLDLVGHARRRVVRSGFRLDLRRRNGAWSRRASGHQHGEQRERGPEPDPERRTLRSVPSSHRSTARGEPWVGRVSTPRPARPPPYRRSAARRAQPAPALAYRRRRTPSAAETAARSRAGRSGS